MLASNAARVSTAARAVASRCTFATTVNSSAGYKVAAINHAQPVAAVTVLIKAGCRFESKPGVAHVLKHFAFKVRL
jgi:ubiquinol-cytochrome c reductase core subunit 2